MKEEAIGVFEGAVGLMLVVSLCGRLMEFVAISCGMLAITSSFRGLHVIREYRKMSVEAEA